ncbi:hypothetical protein [Frankia sp. Mgl5]|uniref:hypothetical protein n=1 Tax=Frankia sp. Mgl5 TaxID=2933793 RepID=UPI00200C5506|nr:hypothetical protein [Frankia sp. Mgl5]
MVGCHGGAGTTTLARLLEPAVDLSLVTDWGRAHLRRWPTVLVTRGTAQAAQVAVDTVAAARAAGVVPRVLVVVGDGPWPEPQAVTARVRLLADRVGTVVRLPYVPRWRYVDDPLAEPLAPAITVAVERIHRALEKET